MHFCSCSVGSVHVENMSVWPHVNVVFVWLLNYLTFFCKKVERFSNIFIVNKLINFPLTFKEIYLRYIPKYLNKFEICQWPNFYNEMIGWSKIETKHYKNSI